MQLLGESSSGLKISQVQIAKNIVANEGVAGLYQGLSAAVMRQATYTTLRLGSYDVIKAMIRPDGKVRFYIAFLDFHGRRRP